VQHPVQYSQQATGAVTYGSINTVSSFGIRNPLAVSLLRVLDQEPRGVALITAPENHECSNLPSEPILLMIADSGEALLVALEIRIEIVHVELILLAAAAAWRGLLVHEERVSVVRAILSLRRSVAT
jgi:hypothetical protein